MGFGPIYDYVPGKKGWISDGRPTEGPGSREPRIGAIARADVPTCGLTDDVEEIRQQVADGGWEACVVVNAERIVLGMLKGRALEESGPAEAAMRPGPSTFRAN